MQRHFFVFFVWSFDINFLKSKPTYLGNTRRDLLSVRWIFVNYALGDHLSNLFLLHLILKLHPVQLVLALDINLVSEVNSETVQLVLLLLAWLLWSPLITAQRINYFLSIPSLHLQRRRVFIGQHRIVLIPQNLQVLRIFAIGIGIRSWEKLLVGRLREKHISCRTVRILVLTGRIRRID